MKTERKIVTSCLIASPSLALDFDDAGMVHACGGKFVREEKFDLFGPDRGQNQMIFVCHETPLAIPSGESIRRRRNSGTETEFSSSN